jgi:hypothetical protein
MTDRTELLMYARRLHNVLRHAIEDGDGRTDDHWLEVEKPIFAHYSCLMYLAGVMSYLEDKYDTRPWQNSGKDFEEFKDYIANCGIDSFQRLAISSSKLEALVCIRNAVIHNSGDLTKNLDKKSHEKVLEADIPHITIAEGVVTLRSPSYQVEFMEFVRQCFLAVCMYHGDG